MNTRLRYGLTETGLRLEVPQNVLEHVEWEIQDFGDALGRGIVRRCVRLTPSAPDRQTLDFDFTNVAAQTYPNQREHRLQYMVRILNDLHASVKPSEEDEALREVGIGSRRTETGRLRMYGDVKWPKAGDNREVRDLVEDQMKRGAKLLGADVDVAVHLSREFGTAVLAVDPAGGCEMSTDATDAEPTGEWLRLSAGNLYSHEQELVCFTGMVALARADELLQQRS